MDFKALREKHNLTQGELADKLGVTPRSVQNWEMGGVIPAPRRKMIEQLFSEEGGCMLAEPAAEYGSKPSQPAPSQASTLDRILNEMVGMRKVVEDQLTVKDTQISKLLDLLGKQAE